MAFFIKFIDGRDITWNLPATPPFGTRYETVKDVAMLQADGDEYEHVINKFSTWSEPNAPTIPIARGNIAIWYGDIAKTILANL